MDTFLIIAIAIVCFCISISISLGLVFSNSSESNIESESDKSNSGKSDTKSESGKSDTPTIVPCNLTCENLSSKFKEFYDTKGEWKNVFTMTPSRYNKVNDTECDVLYTYNPAPGGGRNDSGQDKRRFTVSKDNLCNWTVTSMAGYQSGGSL